MTGKHIVNLTLRLLLLATAAGLLSCPCRLSAQAAPLAPRWLAGTPPPPVETFADGLQRHHIPVTEPALLAALQDPDPEARSLAAAQLAAMDDHPALNPILRAMDIERDPQTQVNLAGAATWLGSRRALDQLQLLCRNANWVPSSVRLDAARYVSNKQQPACFSAVDLIARTDPDPALRAQAVIAASTYWGASDKAATVAVASLPDTDPQVRLAAVDALRFLHARSAIGPLDHALQIEADDTVREHLRETLRILRLPDPEK